MKEFRFVGVGTDGQAVRGTIVARNQRAAGQRITALADQHRFTPDQIEKRSTFIFKVRHPSGDIVKGRQKAYSKEEITQALEKLGLEVLRVDKAVVDFERKPPASDIILFVRLAANLLKEKVPFDVVLNLLINDVSSDSLRQVVRDLNNDLKSGMEAKQAFMKHQHKLGKFTAYMLGIASRSGNMAEIYEATAKFLERKDEFKRSVRSAMITPIITILVTIACFVWYIWYIFPETAGLFAQYNVVLPPMTQASLDFAAWMDVHYWWVGLLTVLTTVGTIIWARSEQGRFFLHKHLIRLPFIGSLLHKLNIEVFCRVFSVLYTGSGENIEHLKVAAEASGNSYIDHQVRTVTVPMMMAHGTHLIPAMEASGVFTSMTIARFRTGAETGTVKASAGQMANYYEKETTLKLKTTIETIQTAVAIFITLAIILLTVVSSEIALISPSATDIMGF